METDTGRVLDVVPAMVWTALPDGSIDFVNRRWSEYTGLRLDEAHGWDWQAAVDPDDLAQLIERWRAILKARAGRHLIHTGFPKSAISFKYFSRAFSSNGVRYYWPWAFSSFERRL